MSDPEDNIFEDKDARFSFIPFDTLTLKKFSFKSFPDVSGLVIRTKFVPNEETGRVFPQKAFFSYNPLISLNECEKINKRKATQLLLVPLTNYLKKKKLRPKRSEFVEKTKTKAGKVKYEIKFSQYDSFNLVFTPEILETSDVSNFVNSIPLDQEDLEKANQDTPPWKVEYARSSRAKCRKCNDKIMKEDLRIGEPSFYENHLSYRWYHKNCISNLKDRNIDGLDDLKDIDKALISNLQGDKSRSITLSSRDKIISLIRQYANSDGLTARIDIKNFGKKEDLSEEQIEEELRKLEEEGLIYTPSPGEISYLG
ncbi:MAG: PARP-type zinc finger-containing protein [Candidatus Hodarchaeales archaeon]|jgi:hypothetical protein